MDRQTYTADDISDLLDLVPALFGFEPEESFIAIATYGERCALGFRLRLDMPPSRHIGAAAGDIAYHLLRQGAEGAILLALTERSRQARDLIAAVTALLDPVPVHAAVRCDGRSYWLHGPDGAGEPVPYVRRSSPVVAEAVLEGVPILPDRRALVARFAAVSGERRAVMEEVVARIVDDTTREMAIHPRPGLGAVGLARLLPILERYDRGEGLDDEDRATLAIWVSCRDVRDAVWATLNCDNAPTALALWTDVAQSVIAPFEPSVLCLASFAAWLTGDGVQALIAAERAAAADPACEMADLILRLLDAGLPPWSWNGSEPDPYF